MTSATSDRISWMHFTFVPGHYADRQAALKAFSQVIKAAVRLDSQTFSHVPMVLMLLELAKNTFDHSSGVGILNLQLPTVGVPLFVSYRDTGAPFDWEACSVLGHSGKAGNGVNYGLGLAIVRQGAKCSGLTLDIERHAEGTEFRFLGT